MRHPIKPKQPSGCPPPGLLTSRVRGSVLQQLPAPAFAWQIDHTVDSVAAKARPPPAVPKQAVVSVPKPPAPILPTFPPVPPWRGESVIKGKGKTDKGKGKGKINIHNDKGKGFQSGKGSHSSEAPELIRRGGWFNKCQGLARAVLAEEWQTAMTMAESYYSGEETV